MGTLYQTDPILRLIPEDGMPDSFKLMSDDEQRWRGRYFLLSYWATHHTAYAWALALAEPAETGRTVVAGIQDEQILAAMRGMDAELREEATAR